VKLRTFAEARDFVHGLELKDVDEWKEFCRSGKKPQDIPSNPGRYKKEWKGYGYLFGTGYIAPWQREYKSFTEARKFVHTLRLKSSDEWRKYCKSGNKPDDIPANPASHYRQEWKGMGDWLGTGYLVSLAKPSTTSEIWNYLDSRTSQVNKRIELEAQEKFENDELHSRKEMEYYISSNKKETISIRTIQRCIKKDKRIKNENDRYYVTDDARNETKYIDARVFGNEVFGMLKVPIANGTTSTVEQILLELVQAYGAFVIYAFIEAARPFEDDSLDPYERDMLAESWIQNAIPIEGMFTSFHAKFTDKQHRNYDPETESLNELDNETIKRLTQALKKKYPVFYKDMYRARQHIMGKRVGRTFDADISDEE
jgi:hypothetical protein